MADEITDVNDNDFTEEELQELFGDIVQDPPTAEEGKTADTTKSDEEKQKELEDKVETTSAFSRRLNERTTKAVNSERESIAKMMGYESYEAMTKAAQDKLFVDNGINPEAGRKVLDKMTETSKLSDAKYQKFLESEVEENTKRELGELSKLLGQQVTSLSQVPKDVIDDWATSGNLKASYMKLHGEELLIKTRKAAATGTTTHMQSAGTGSGAPNSHERLLTEDEKRAWKMMFPHMSNEELNKMTKKIT